MEKTPHQPGQHTVGADNPNKESWKSWLYIGILIFAAAVAAYVIWWAAEQTTSQLVVVETSKTTPTKQIATEPPKIATQVVADGLQHVWGVEFLPTNEMIFTERNGRVSAFINGQVRQLATISDVKVNGEGGLLGLAVDPDFKNNRYIYTCFNTASDIKVARFKINADITGLGDRKDIITGIQSNPSGRHSGCRVAFGLDGYLWVGTGDAAINDTNPQSPTSLAGKILRVDRDGNAASGNLGGDFDPRIFSYGHRNTQGLAFFAKPINGVQGVSVEHGSYVDDEINPLLPGNFGWSPGAGYNEMGVPMTDKTRFPDAIDSIWSSGKSTIATSGAAILKGDNWKLWEGAVAVSVLKDKHLRIFQMDDKLRLVKQDELFNGEFGRLRAATMGPDNALYISSSNDTNDKIIKVYTTE